jgi:hypothetical protein
VHGRLSPSLPSSRGDVTGLREAPGDLADREPVVGVAREDLSDEGSLLLVHHHVGGHPVSSRDPAVTEGNGGPEDLALTRAMELAATIAFRDPDAFIFGHGSLDLDEECGVRIVPGRLVQEDHLDPEAIELLEDEHEVGVLAGEPIRSMDEHGIEGPGESAVPDPVQPRTGQRGSTHAFIDTDVVLGHGVVSFLGVREESRELGVDRAALPIVLRGDPRVDRNSHLPSLLSWERRGTGCRRSFRRRSEATVCGPASPDRTKAEEEPRARARRRPAEHDHRAARRTPGGRSDPTANPRARPRAPRRGRGCAAVRRSVGPGGEVGVVAGRLQTFFFERRSRRRRSTVRL